MNTTTITIRDTFKDDYITREAGERLREIIMQFRKKKQKLILDFSNLMVASPSFFDEAIAKLVNEGWTSATVDQWVTLIGIHPRDIEILNEMKRNRGL